MRMQRSVPLSSSGFKLSYKVIELPVPTKIFKVYNQLRRTGYGTAYCKIRFHYEDGMEENSTERSDSDTAFNSLSNYLNPNPDKNVNKISVWLKNSSGTSSTYQAYEMGTGFVSLDEVSSSVDTYNQEVKLWADADSNFVKIKEITLPEAGLLEGVMNEIKSGGSGTQYCK